MFRHQIYQLGYTHPPFHTSYLDDCRGGTPWPPQFFDEGVLRRIGAATECRPYSLSRGRQVRVLCLPYGAGVELSHHSREAAGGG